MSLGIDFGTTRTVVATADRGNYPVVSFENDAGDLVEWFPSIVAERSGDFRFGFDALAVATDPSFSQVRSFKRLLAGDEVMASSTLTIGSSRIHLRELVERFLSSLAEALRTRSNLPKGKKKERFEAVVATPANAFCAQRFATLDAFRRAGFDVRAMLNEPSAAGFEYSHRHARTFTSKREHVIVYDLGGGTFDASLVRVTGTHHDVVATAGLANLGGDDFDRVLLDLVAKRAKLDLGKLAVHEMQRLLDSCRDAKESLHASSKKMAIDLASCLDAQAPEVSVSVADYFEAVAPLVERTLVAMEPLVTRSEGGGDSGELSDVAGVYIVGGASALPVVGRMLKSRFGKRVHRSPYPHASVAIGLAIAGDTNSGFVLDDSFSRNFGVFREAKSGEKPIYDAIFRRDMRLPREGEPSLVVRRRYRAAHDLGHYRFFECAAFDEDGEPRGELAPLTDLLFPFSVSLRDEQIDLKRVPARRLEHAGPAIEESYAVDARGMVVVTITDVDTGFARRLVVGAGDARASAS